MTSRPTPDGTNTQPVSKAATIADVRAAFLAADKKLYMDNFGESIMLSQSAGGMLTHDQWLEIRDDNTVIYTSRLVETGDATSKSNTGFPVRGEFEVEISCEEGISMINRWSFELLEF